MTIIKQSAIIEAVETNMKEPTIADYSSVTLLELLGAILVSAHLDNLVYFKITYMDDKDCWLMILYSKADDEHISHFYLLRKATIKDVPNWIAWALDEASDMEVV